MADVPKQIRLTREQIDFLRYMLEESDKNKAAEGFAMIMIEEGLSIQDIGPYLDKIMVAWSKRK